jgi:predicted hotdog family 3-hydroxylacyl-ACP dehydratase
MNQLAEFNPAQILPHEGRMLLIDELIEQHEGGIVTALTIRTDSVLCDGVTGVPTWVGMEYMAQTACAYSGVNEAREGKKPSISLLLGTRSYKAHVPVFKIGTRLIISASLVVRDDDDLAVFDCSIRDAASSEELASGDIKAIRPRDLQGLIQAQLRG